MSIIIGIFFLIIAVEAIIHMHYSNKFHEHLMKNYRDLEKLTLFNLSGGVTGFRTLINLLSNNEKSLQDKYLTEMKKKARFWIGMVLLTMIALPILFSIISIIRVFIDEI